MRKLTTNEIKDLFTSESDFFEFTDPKKLYIDEPDKNTPSIVLLRVKPIQYQNVLLPIKVTKQNYISFGGLFNNKGIKRIIRGKTKEEFIQNFVILINKGFDRYLNLK